MLTLCGEILVDRYEMAKMATDVVHACRQNRLSSKYGRVYAGLTAFGLDILEHPWMERLKLAEQDLLADFRAQLASGKIELLGLQTEPVLARELAPLAPTWAERMQFDWQQQTVRVAGALFADVVGRPKQPAVRDELVNQRPKRGRPRFPMDEMVTIACTRLGTRTSSRKGEANALLAEFRKRHPSATPPTVRTIEGHVKEIYAAAARNEGALKA
ncbi:hypothetical protein D9599_29450 [Roseomonas sp. KE2513]|nr:hypothetical protein [Roseomonas sp. KE2513]